MGNPVFRVLADRGRRHIIDALLTSDDRIVTLSDLTQEVAAQCDDREQVRCRLYHHHLPKLKKAGIVDYDWRSGDVVLTANTDDLRPLLDGYEEEREIPLT